MAHPVLIDTSIWVEAMRRQGDPDARRLVAATMASGAARTCDFVQLELWNGLSGTEERRWLAEVEAAIEIVPTCPEVWAQARQLATAARERGLTIPASDLLIAACARIHGLTVLHRDSHFDRLAELVPLAAAYGRRSAVASGVSGGPRHPPRSPPTGRTRPAPKT